MADGLNLIDQDWNIWILQYYLVLTDFHAEQTNMHAVQRHARRECNYQTEFPTFEDDK
jgi:hypothetical protein